MVQARRQDDRRLRVILSTGNDASTGRSADIRGDSEGWREARRPSVAYGTRVRHSLRGRWFSLVPVPPLAMAIVAATAVAMVASLTLLHHATLSLAALGHRDEMIAVLRIDAPGSLARYVNGVLWLVMAGIACLIYQLRSYRNDDFQGRYRLWRAVMVGCLLASLATMVPVIAMAGAMLESLIGQRVALSGRDWTLLLITLGASALALRTIVEMASHRMSAFWCVLGWTTIAFPVAAHWNLVAINTPWRWTLITAAPLIATACWFLAMTLYLRALVGQVRGQASTAAVISATSDSASTAERSTIWPRIGWPHWRLPRLGWSRKSAIGAEENAEPARRLSVARKVAAPRPTPARPEPTTAKPTPTQPTSTPAAGLTKSDSPAEGKPAVSRAKRGWWPLGKRTKSAGDETVTPEKPKPSAATKSASAPASAPAATKAKENGDESADETSKRRFRFGLSSWRTSRAEAAKSSGSAPSSSSATAARPSSPASAANRGSVGSSQSDDDEGDDDGDDEGLDTSNMSKAERRRARKLLKRTGRAA